MATDLVSLSDAKAFLGITGTSQDKRLAGVLAGVEKAVRTYCHRDFTSKERTEYYNGNNRQRLALRERPVTTVTSVQLDNTGYFGKASGSFGASSTLTEGTSWVLSYDSRDSGVSDSGVLIKLPGVQSTFVTISEQREAIWPLGVGNIKVVYTAGYTTIPADLQLAVKMLTSLTHASADQGGPLESETLGDYSYTRAAGMISGNGKGPRDLVDVRRILAGYREFTI